MKNIGNICVFLLSVDSATRKGSQSTREATLSGAMRGILRSGRRVALQRDFEFRSHRRMNPWNSKRERFCDALPAATVFFTLFSVKQKSCSPKRTAHCIISDYARVTLPERRQRVQTFTRFTSPSTIARTVCTLGFHAALV